MQKYYCDDCGNEIPPECVEHDEGVKTLLFQMMAGTVMAGAKHRVLVISASDHDEAPKHPYVDGVPCDLCATCVVNSLLAVTTVQPVAAEA